MLTESLDLIAQTAPMAFIRTGRAAYASVNAIHILGVALLVGAILDSDLRTSGIWKENLWREGLETSSPVAAVGLALAVVTGALLLSVRGGHYLAHPAFLIKMLTLMVGLANVLVFRWAIARQAGGSPSPTMRLSAICSIMIWVGAISMGRWIAFAS